MTRRPILAGLLAAWLAIAPCAALASGAGMLMPSATGAQLAPLATGSPPTFNQITTNSQAIGAPSATLISTPATGDWLIAVVTVGTFSPTMGPGWTEVELLNNCATAPLMLIAYHQVQVGDGATFTPATDAQPGASSVAIADVGTSLPSWAALDQQIAYNCAGGIPASVTVSQNGARNSGVFAVGYVNVPTSGYLHGVPTMSGVTGDLQSSYADAGGGSAAGIVAANGILTGSMFPPASATVNCPASSNNCGEAFGILIFLNP